MPRALRTGLALALALAATGRVSSADPATPQLSPLHRQREDAQRLTEQQRGLEAPAPAAPQPAAALTSPLPTRSAARNTTRGTGFVLLGIAGVSAIVAVPLLVASSIKTDSEDSSLEPIDTLSKLLIATSVLAGLAGVVLLASDRKVQVSPAVSPRAVGIAISGRL
jgi:hypothetical protein